MRFAVFAVVLVAMCAVWVAYPAAQEENQAPVADAGDNQSVDVGAEVELDGRGSYDPDGDALYYQWTQTGGTDVELDGANTSTTTFNANAAGEFYFQLVVTDGQLSSAPDEVRVTVAAASDDDADDDQADDDAVWEPENDDEPGCGF